VDKDGKVISLNKDMSEEFNKFFVSVLLTRAMKAFLKLNGCIKE